jgi:PAS domain S-box-containing protein
MKIDIVKSLIIASLVLTLGTLALNHYHIKSNVELTDAIMHTQEILDASSDVFSTMKDIEIGQRGYLISGDSLYLEPYFDATRTLNPLLENLIHLTLRDSAEQALVQSKIKPLAESKLAVASHGIHLFDKYGRDSAIAYTRTQIGKNLMDSLEANVNRLTDRERFKLSNHKASLKAFSKIMDPARYISIVFIALICLFGLLAFGDQQRKTARLFTALKILNEDLENRVATRTKDLENANEELRSFHEALEIRNKHTEESLQEVRDLYDNAPCGYHSIDKNGTIIRMNRTELQWLGYKAEEVIGKMNVNKIIDQSYAQQRAKDIEKLGLVGHLENLEFDMIRKDGSRFSVLLNTSAMYDSRGQYSKNRSTVFDITERKKMEAQLRRANENLIHLNEEKNSLLGIASHDLKSPLNSVLGLVSLLKADAANFTKDQKKSLDLIFDSSKRMKEMIDKLLDLNRIEEGKTLAQRSRFDIVSQVRKNLLAFQEQLHKKNILLEFASSTEAVDIESDPAIVQQILDNLVSNAIKFSPPKRKIFVTITRTSDHVSLEVRDQGQGIKPEEMHKLFNKFQTLSARPTGGEQSTGLGLSIVKTLVEILHGEITCTSEVNAGTTFLVTLPLA